MPCLELLHSGCIIKQTQGYTTKQVLQIEYAFE